ncbi:trypsin II-P29-like [Embiotoca jacksoni]|uniref:trypsin II-P29-like n=1 Tax=Embiotoca jacksoni TaxID=100190 RepID=UPI003703D922
MCKFNSGLLSDCGRRDSKIIEGEDASEGSWPWQVALYMYGYFSCGGSLINDQWVLTSARCIARDELQHAKIFLGRYNRTGANPNEVSRTLEDIICHPKYNTPLFFDNDICLLKLSAPVAFTKYIKPICLASENSTFYSGTSSWVTGFGITDGNLLPDILQEVNVPVVGNNRCSCSYKDNYEITENMLCAGFGGGGKDSCYGDEGGPLMAKIGHRWVQSGVMSFGLGCDRPNYPGTYTRVSQYQDWILKTINGKEPGFVTFTSPGVDKDVDFTCQTSQPTSRPTSQQTSRPTSRPTYRPTYPISDDSIFGTGENLIHFTHFISLSVLALLLHVLAGSGGM